MPMIPFGWLPGHWGLRGKTREMARVEYEFDTDEYERDMKLAHIQHDSDIALKREILIIQLEYKRIDQREYDEGIIELIDNEFLQKEAAIDLLLKYGDITELEHEKEIATLACRPWFHFDVDYADGELELTTDWNTHYIDMLRTVGYKGADDAAIIDDYVRDFGRKLSADPEEEDDDVQNGMPFVDTGALREYK